MIFEEIFAHIFETYIFINCQRIEVQELLQTARLLYLFTLFTNF